jgi:hypothetical protein
MKKRSTSRVIAISLAVLAVAAFIGMKVSDWNNLISKAAAGIVPPKNRLVVHEWGTFTSISGIDGVALEWRPLNGSTDLPGFVHTIQEGAKGLRHPSLKADLAATVRMETPVLYFYSDNEMDVSVKVDFPKGKITEWYPQARDVGTSIDWGRLRVMPGAAFNLPVEYKESHYYPARETDSAPVQVCATNGKLVQQEKFLFYRGVGTFDLPVSVKLEGNSVALKNLGKDEIAHVIVFENRGGKIGYRLSKGLTAEVTQARPELDKSIDSLVRELKQILVAAGLFEKEADAMIKTWRDNWFEAGLRVFYILPRRTTDAVLPVTIEPRPTELVRVLVGRTELITPEMEKSVQRQANLLRAPSAKVREDAAREIRKYGRFSEPILKRILETEKDSSIRHRIQQLIDQRPEKLVTNTERTVNRGQ